MYVAAPILQDDTIIGGPSVGKPTGNINTFVNAAKKKVVFAGAMTAAAAIVVGLFVTVMVTQPIHRLRDYALAIRDGKRTALPALGGGDLAELGNAFEEMRDALEGKQYVEHYVQALTHEVKSPISAIRGAVELLREAMPAADRRRFLDNIDNESGRILAVVEKLLLLSSL